MAYDEGKSLEQTDAEEAFLKRVFRNFHETLWRRRLWISAYCLLIVIGTAIVTVRMPSYYRATVTLLIDSDMVQDPAEQRSLSNLDLQATIIQSPEIFDRVIEKTNLSSDPLFTEKTTPRDELAKHLTVEPDKTNKTIQIHYLDTRPELAAVISNQLAQEYVYEKIARSSGVNVESIDSLKKRVDQEMEKLNAVKTKIAELNRENPDLGNESVVGDQVKFLNSEYIRIDARALQLRTTIAELEALIKNNGSMENHPAFSSHPRVKGKLEQVRAAELDALQLEQEYRGMHPLVLRAQTKLKALQNSLEQEKTQVLAEFRADLGTAETTLQKLRESIMSLQAKDKELTPQKLAYKNLLTEQESISGTINLLNTQISKASVAGSFKQTGIDILSYAAVPQDPFSPNKPRNIFLAVIFALFSSLGFIFLRCYFDHSFRSEEDIEQILMKPFMGHLPAVRVAKDTLEPDFKDEKEKTYFLNFLRLICANSNFLIASKGNATVMVTGSRPGEGKSFVAYHLAKTFALEGKATVLVDVDFCRSVLSFLFPELGHRPGLHDYLMGDVEAEEIISATEHSNLFFIQSQEAKFSAPHALRSDRMQALLRHLKQHFDIIILDTPPVLSINDAVALGEIVDLRLMIVEWGKTPKEQVERAMKKIAPSNLVLCGVVLNKAKHWGANYYYDHAYEDKRKKAYQKKMVVQPPKKQEPGPGGQQ